MQKTRSDDLNIVVKEKVKIVKMSSTVTPIAGQIWFWLFKEKTNSFSRAG